MNTLELPFAGESGPVWLGDGIALLRGFADTATLMPLIERVAVCAPFRHLVTPGGQTMSMSQGSKPRKVENLKIPEQKPLSRMSDC